MAGTTTTSGGMIEWLKENPALSIGGGLILVLIIAGKFMQPKTPAQSNPNADLSGLTNGLVYVPTQTSFTTENINSNNPTTTTNTSTSTTTTNTGGGDNNRKIIVSPFHNPNRLIRNPPAPPPRPPQTHKGLVWDQRYTIRGGDTLSIIAARLTHTLRGQGMPGSQSISWHDLYAHNTSVINADSAAHHNPIPGGPWNDVFPGESITVPRWG